MRIIAALVIAAVLLSGPRWSAEAAEDPGRRVALVIGNAAYQHVARLQLSVNDATDIGAALRRIGFDVTVLLDAGRAEMEQAVRAFRNKLRGAEVGLFFYSGHGLEVDGRNLLVPVSANVQDPRDLPYETLALNDVIDEMNSAEPRFKLIILDACRDNPFAEVFQRAARTASRGVAVTRGLSVVQAPVGTVIAYSTAPGTVAYEAPGNERNGFYTKALLENIERPGVEVGTLFRRVRERVLEQTGGLPQGQQVPWDSFSLTGEFYFVPPPPPTASAPATGPGPGTGAGDAAAAEAAIWTGIVSMPPSPAKRAALQQYLATYPNGQFVRFAEIMLASLPETGTAVAANPTNGTNPAAGNSDPRRADPTDKPVAAVSLPPRPEVNRRPTVASDPVIPIVRARGSIALGVPAPNDPEGDPLTVTFSQIPEGLVIRHDRRAVRPGERLAASEWPQLTLRVTTDRGAVRDPVLYEVEDGHGNRAGGRLFVEVDQREPALRDLTAAEEQLEVEDRRMIQQALATIGFYHSTVDGSFGRGTRTAIEAFQASLGRPQTGYLTGEQLDILFQRADTDNPAYQNSRGVLYTVGRLLAHNAVEAARWYRPAADHGEAVAQYNLGRQYRSGEGVPQNRDEALRLFMRSATGGFYVAQHELGQMYERGEGVTRDIQQARYWYQQAASQGWPESRAALQRLGGN